MDKKADALAAAALGAIGGAAGWATTLALQKGMNTAKRFIWKQMTPTQKAKYLLGRALKATGVKK